MRQKIRDKAKEVPKRVFIGLIGVVLMYVGLAGTASAMTPYWPGRGDTVAHVDYVWRLYNGSIPMWDDGVTYPKFLELKKSPVNFQPASANPPFFYLIHAPAVGYLLEEGRWKPAIAVGRIINVFMGIACIFALAWATWMLGGKYRDLLTVTVPAFAVLNYRFAILNLDFALDALIVLLSTLMFVVAYKVVTLGIDRKRLLSLTTLSVLGMLTKATFIVFVAVGILSVILSELMKSKKINKSLILRICKYSVAVLIVVTLLSGWFYFTWNFLRTGSWFSPFPEGFTGGREVKPLHDVLTDTRLWELFYASYSRLEVVSIAITSFAVAGWLSFKGSYKKLLSKKEDAVFLLLLVIATIGIFATQIVHAVGIGAYNFRYMLPAIFPLSLFLSWGILQLARMKRSILFTSIILMSLSTFYILPKLPTFRGGVPGINDISGGTAPKIRHAFANNGIPEIVAYALFGMFIVGAILYLSSLFYDATLRSGLDPRRYFRKAKYLPKKFISFLQN